MRGIALCEAMSPYTIQHRVKTPQHSIVISSAFYFTLLHLYEGHTTGRSSFLWPFFIIFIFSKYFHFPHFIFCFIFLSTCLSVSVCPSVHSFTSPHCFLPGGYKVRKEPSLTKRCEKSGKDAKRAKFHEETGTTI